MGEREASFRLSLRQRWNAADSLLCVGLDPDPRRIPHHLGQGPAAILAFCREIVDATADQVCAFKPQIAYFAAGRAEGVPEELIDYIHERHPAIPVILDAKRGDIGNTAEQYAVKAFERYRADALTVSPFMGLDSIEPYLAWPGKGVILLCRTSNPGGSDFQLLESGGERLFERIARLASGDWNNDGKGSELGLVVGATYPEELRRVRELAPAVPVLVPGIGAQSGDRHEQSECQQQPTEELGGARRQRVPASRLQAERLDLESRDIYNLPAFADESSDRLDVLVVEVGILQQLRE